jgi:hypothetical protein
MNCCPTHLLIPFFPESVSYSALLSVLLLTSTFVSLFFQLQNCVIAACLIKHTQYNILVLQFAVPVIRVSVLYVAAYADLIEPSYI